MLRKSRRLQQDNTCTLPSVFDVHQDDENDDKGSQILTTLRLTSTSATTSSTTVKKKRKRLRRKRKKWHNYSGHKMLIKMLWGCSILLFLVFVYLFYQNIVKRRSGELKKTSDLMQQVQVPLSVRLQLPILHIVNTRFMQNQPKLKILARARLHLFKTFCLPSMVHQSIQNNDNVGASSSSSNFIWIIKIDPKLDETIKAELISLVQRYNNFYIVASNVNYMVGTTPGSWRSGAESDSILQNIEEKNVLTGDIDLLRGYAILGSEDDNDDDCCIILETRLDADDGLNNRYLELIQRDAMRIFSDKHENEISNDEKLKWHFWCVEKHANWYPYKGDELGRISGHRLQNYCITPGLTVGYNIGTMGDEVPYHSHHVLYNEIVTNKHDGADTNDKNHTLSYNCRLSSSSSSSSDICLSFVTQMVAAVRSRTYTSAGMKDTNYLSRFEIDAELTDWIWEKLKHEFGVSVDSVIKMHHYLRLHAKQIAKENLIGQCTDGHSCKDETKETLKDFIGIGNGN